MTHPDEPRVTELDPGRERPPPPMATSLDHGRRPGPAADEAFETTLDAGRARPDDPSWGVAFPPALAARYEPIRRLEVSAAEAELYLVRELEPPGRELVLKVYHRDRRPDERVWEALRRRRTEHLVELVECGREGARSYEVQEYLNGGDLAGLRHPGWTDGQLGTLVQQVSTALAELHDGGIVHGDVKPANLMRRGRHRLDVVLVDFGISTVTDGSFERTAPATLAYAPPEWDSKYVAAPGDWWALGITLVELATGRHPFEGLSTGPVRRHVTTRPVDLSGVQDDRIRRLCQGLLTRDPASRWNAEKVRSWLAGESPELTRDDAADQRPGAADAFPFNDEQYRHRDMLATALATAWEFAAQRLFGPDRTAFTALIEWLRQFPEYQGPDGADALAALERLPKAKRTNDVKLLRLLHTLDPIRVPTYRRETITAALLPELARRALSPGPAQATVVDLCEHNLLPLLATASAQQASGAGLAEANAEWRATRARWDDAIKAVDDADARSALRVESSGTVDALCLLAATATASDRATIEAAVREVNSAFPVPLPWYDELARPGRERLALYLAWQLGRLATTQARERHERIEAERQRAVWRNANQNLVRWAQRQSQLVALGWAVAGTVAMAALWVLFIGISDCAGVASDAVITDGWVTSILSIGVVLAVESILAILIGTRYPLRFSLISAGLAAVRPLAVRAQHNGVAAFGVLVAISLVVGLVVVSLPPLVPPVMTIAVIFWSATRYRAWLDEVRQEEENDRDHARVEGGAGRRSEP